MPVKIKRKDALDLYANLPRDERREGGPQTQKAYQTGTFTVSATSIKDHFKTLSASLTKLALDLGFDSFIFLGVTKRPWLFQNSDYKPVRAALQYLRDNKVGPRFNGALEVDIKELNTFIPHLCWLIRCNAALPIFHFMDKGENFIGSICKYGNVHYYLQNEKTHLQFGQSIDGSRIVDMIDSLCNEQYSKTGAIANRQIYL